MRPCNGNKTCPENIEVKQPEKAEKESGAGSGDDPEHFDCKDTSENSKSNHTEYIPSQIVSFVTTSGVNTVSHGTSGQPTASSSRKNESMTDSKKYRESQSLYDTTGKEKESEDHPVAKKRKVESNDSVRKMDSSPEHSQSLELENTTDENSSHSTTSESAQIIDQIEDDKGSECNTPATYVPSEYGSFQKSGCGITTTTKSKLSGSDKIQAQSSTNTPNSKGGISHDDA